MVVGCGSGSAVTTYQVAKPLRMRVAMLVDEGRSQVWFVKLMGPQSMVSREGERFDGLVASLRLDESTGELAYEVPSSWTKESSDQPMVGTTLVISSGEDPSKVTITRLGLPGDESLEEYTLRNVNRWRAQLSLEPIDLASLPSEVEQRVLDEGTLTLVSLAGREPDGAERNVAGAAPVRQSGSVPESGGPSVLAGEMPGWEKGGGTAFSVLSLSKTEGDETASITVSPLQVISSWEANVERWVGQVGAAPLSGAEIEELTEAVVVDGLEGEWISLESDSAVASPTRLVAVRVIQGQTAWFIRMSGPAELVGAEIENFKTWLTTLDLPE